MQQNPGVFIKEFETSEVLETKSNELCLQNNKVKYSVLKKIPDGGKVRWREIEETATKRDFIKTAVNEYGKFIANVQRVHNQYKEIRKLRENLPEKK